MNTNAIRETIALAERISPADFSEPSRKVEWAEAQISHINNLLKDLLGIEAEAKWNLESQLRNTQNHRRTLMDEIERLQRLNKISGIYQRLSLEPLTWRDSQGFPRLVVFTLESPTFSLAILDNDRFWVEPHLPKNIGDQYKDVLQLLETSRPKRGGLALACKFNGLIPHVAREKIKEAQELFSSYIFIVAEPKSFVLNEIAPLPKGDPLIVGYDPKIDANSLWLIADFDTTPVEEAMIFHFDNNQK